MNWSDTWPPLLVTLRTRNSCWNVATATDYGKRYSKSFSKYKYIHLFEVDKLLYQKAFIASSRSGSVLGNFL